MVHKMRLVDFAFNAIKNGDKDIEVRLYDEKRQLIKVGDIIEFEHIDTGDILKVKVQELHIFKTFDELFNHFDHSRLGVENDCESSIMNNFYSLDEQKRYNVVGIEIKKV